MKHTIIYALQEVQLSAESILGIQNALPWVERESRGAHNLQREINLQIQDGKSDHLPSRWQVTRVTFAPADLLRT